MSGTGGQGEDIASVIGALTALAGAVDRTLPDDATLTKAEIVRFIRRTVELYVAEQQ